MMKVRKQLATELLAKTENGMMHIRLNNSYQSSSITISTCILLNSTQEKMALSGLTQASAEQIAQDILLNLQKRLSHLVSSLVEESTKLSMPQTGKTD